MDTIKAVLDKLKSEGVNATYEEKLRIVWKDQFNREQYIYKTDIDYLDDKLSWFQSSNNSEFLLRVFESGGVFNWIPITYNYSEPCDCHLLEFYDDYLIFIYHEKHDVYICIIKNHDVTHFKFHGDEIKRKNDTFFFREYRSKEDSNDVRRLRIPELFELETITEEEAKKENAVPETIGYSVLARV